MRLSTSDMARQLADLEVSVRDMGAPFVFFIRH